MRGESYRRCCTSVAWVGQAMRERGQDYSANWARQGQAWGGESPADRMVEEMWAKYRKTLKAPVDGWKRKNWMYVNGAIRCGADIRALAKEIE